MILIDGKKIGQKIKEEVREEVKKLKLTLSLHTILIGQNKASEVFVRQKEKACREVGIRFYLHRFPPTVSSKKAENLIARLNSNPKVDGILIQLPLPKKLETLLDQIDPKKDVDCLTSVNFGKFALGKPFFVPPTVQAVDEILKREKIKVKGKIATVVGAGRVAGLPIALFLLQKGATVTVCHEFTKDLKEHTQKADILVSAAGQPQLIRKEMVKKEAVVIDVGTSWEKGKIVGDVDCHSFKERARVIVPVPGGIGPLTVAFLLKNTLLAGKKKLTQ